MGILSTVSTIIRWRILTESGHPNKNLVIKVTDEGKDHQDGRLT